jgi:phosphoenolpyruvate synthase/pyruvate phosphate dikinase
VQLLARNLGIPNVVVTESVLPQVAAQSGQQVVMAVSPKGVVQLVKDGPRWDDIFGKEELVEAITIKPDLEKLDTTVTDLVPLADLRAEDSGRISGPKGANLGSLRHYFGNSVPDGFVVPFGVFRQVLDKPLEPGGPSVWDWMRGEYDAIAALESSPDQQQKRVRKFLGRLRSWIMKVDLGDDFRQRLRTQLRTQFGKDGSYGAFVRSDTNVEDLPGFTGAGLNLTVPNVVGEKNIENAIHDVWASPFTERAYSWRQGNMEDPEYVFPAVVVQYSLPSEKSGVMVTADLDTGSMRTYLSVAVSEGVGGAVDGQATESLRINKTNASARLLAQATAPTRATLVKTGGMAMTPSTGTDSVLKPKEIEQLITFAAEAPDRFPSLREGGTQVPADVEFGFRDGKLYLLQLRPFVESKAAQANSYLAELDQVFRTRGRARVDLDARPEGGI